MNGLFMGFENIITANGLTIAIVGMFIVFLALAIISLFISLLPKVLPLMAKVLPEVHHHHNSSVSQSPDHDEVLAAIAYALFRKQAKSLPAE